MAEREQLGSQHESDSPERTPHFQVVKNDEEQYSLWPLGRDLPSGWFPEGKVGPKGECLAYIGRVWTDMRPASLRRDSVRDSSDESGVATLLRSSTEHGKGESMRVGLILPMGDDTWSGAPRRYEEIREFALQAEESGFESIWFADHLLADSLEDVEDSPWECWTLMTAIAAVTSDITIGSLVVCAGFRNPAILARMADTLQEVSGGRLVLGLGAGWHETEFRAFNVPFEGRVSRFEEAVAIIASMLRDGRANFSGAYHTALGAPIRSRAQRPIPEILIAGVAKRMLRIAATYADSWNVIFFGRPDSVFRKLNDDLDAACRAVGRAPSAVKRTVGMRIARPGGGEAAPRCVEPKVDSIVDALHDWEREGVAEVMCLAEPCDRDHMKILEKAVARYRNEGETNR